MRGSSSSSRRRRRRTPVEVSLSMVCYFEIEIKTESSRRACLDLEGGMTSIGLGTKSFPLDGKQPGWTRDSYGYHGDDGNKFHGGGLGRAYGPGFGAGDVVGCGLNYHNNKVFFTKNGQFLGTAFVCHFYGQPLYPLVGIDSFHSVEFNFGTQGPFRFDIIGYEGEAWEEAGEAWGGNHMNLQALVERNIRWSFPEGPGGESGAGGSLNPPVPGGGEYSSASESWEHSRSLLLDMISSLGQQGDLQLHFEWQGDQLALMAGPPPTPAEAVEKALTSEEANFAFRHGVRLLQQAGNLVLVPMSGPGDEDLEDQEGDGEDTEEEEEEDFVPLNGNLIDLLGMEPHEEEEGDGDDGDDSDDSDFDEQHHLG